MKKLFLFIIAAIHLSVASAFEMSSPDGQLTVRTALDNGTTSLVLCRQGATELMRIGLGLTTTAESFAPPLTLTSQTPVERSTEHYTSLHGKQREVQKNYQHTTLSLKSASGATLQVELRLFHDGLAFRYRLPAATRTFTDELTTFRVPRDNHRWLQKFAPHYEGDFPYQATAGKQGAWGYPALFQAANGSFMLITEANPTRQYCVTHLDNTADADTYKVSFPFAWEGNNTGAVNPVWTGAWTSPWRIVIAGELKDVVASTLVEDVSDATTMTDTAWIQPGRAAWIYWAYNHGTKDYQICRQYVDLAVEMGWEYVLFDWEWDAMTNGGTIADACRYAVSKGVKPWMWYNSGGPHTGVPATPRDRMLTHENRVKEFAWLKSMGIVGVKIDFFESDKQNIIAYYLDILDDAAEARLMINFHGCTLPRGWSRTYPHLMSQEAVFGAEQYNNTPYMTDNGARINCLLPYTRNVVGPMDYTPVAFTNSQHPHRTSFAHELALSVAFESGLQHWADRPEGFRALPDEAKQHMRQVPVVWDETRFLAGYPGESFVVARRSGAIWYVAALNGTSQPLTIDLPLSFLGQGVYNLTAFADGADSTAIATTHHRLSAASTYRIDCLSQGGCLMRFNPADGKKKKK